jgi:hypothetical protein
MQSSNKLAIDYYKEIGAFDEKSSPCEERFNIHFCRGHYQYEYCHSIIGTVYRQFL